MAKFIGLNLYLSVNGVELSNHASQIEVDEAAEEVDLTGFGAKFKEIGLGIGTAMISVTLFQDFAAGSVDATLHALQGSNTPFPVAVRAINEAASLTNPEYKMEAVLPEYKPLSTTVGSASTVQVTFKNYAQAGIERLT